MPIPDLRLYVLDAKQRPVPPGVVGEIYVGGAGVARGYLNRPELTAERFIADPFSDAVDARMYRSGDLARLLQSGDIEYLGRADTQVKIRGFRIELGEIESALVAHPAVLQAAAVARQDVAGQPRLVAYFVAKPGRAAPAAEIRDFLQAKLPAHMIPHACVPIDAIPLTINGKVDQAALPVPDADTGSQARQYVPPRTAQERALAQILSEVLRVERVGLTDNLFELGADSLHVFQITSRATKAGLRVTPKLILQQRTIGGIMAELTVTQPPAQAQVIVPVERQMYRVKRESPRGARAQD
jgi:aryl carrier-like protein